MADFAWLAAVPHKNIGGSGHKLAPKESIHMAMSKSCSAMSIHGATDEHGLLYEQTSSVYINETKSKTQKPPMSAVKGAWQHTSLHKPTRLRADGIPHGRPGSAASDFDQLNIGNSRPASARSERDAAVVVYKAMKQHRGQSGNDGSRHLALDSSQIGSRSGHSRPNSAYRLLPFHVDAADSVNKSLEDDIEHLQGPLIGVERSYDQFGNEDLGAEFITVTQEKTLGPRPKSGRDRGSPSDLDSSHSHTDSDDSRFSKGYNSRHSSRQGSHQNSRQGSGHKSGHSTRHSSGLKGKYDLNYVVEDLEKDGHGSGRKDLSRDANSNLPEIVIGDNDTEEPESKKVKTKTETMAESRKRKLLMKLKYATAFKTLFDDTRAESLRATMDMNKCYNIKDLSQAKSDEKKEEDRFKNMNSLNPNLPAGVPVKSGMDLQGSKSKTRSFLNLSEAGHYMSPESLAIMRSTLDEKHLKNIGDQPWLLGRLALSKRTCRFELPMDMLVLKTITPMEYLMRYCIISRRRKTLYKNVFQKMDKDRDGWITNEELVKALKDIHVNYIDQNEIDTLSEILRLDKSPKNKYNTMMFSVISAFSERLVLYLRKLDRRKDKSLKERLEVADFSNLRWKLEGVDVNPPVRTLLEVL